MHEDDQDRLVRLIRLIAALEEADGDIQLRLPAYLSRPIVDVRVGDYL